MSTTNSRRLYDVRHRKAAPRKLEPKKNRVDRGRLLYDARRGPADRKRDAARELAELQAELDAPPDDAA